MKTSGGVGHQLTKPDSAPDKKWSWLRKVRANKFERAMSFGVTYLDLACEKITPSDLIIIGCATGGGKTEFCTNLIETNAKADKRVTYFALEAERGEIHQRLLYRRSASKYFEDTSREYIPCVDFAKFLTGQLPASFDKYIEASEREITQRLKNMNIIYNTTRFTISELKKQIGLHKDTTDLFVIDHLHFFDLEPGVNENEHLAAIMYELRHQLMDIDIPVVVITQLRKDQHYSQSKQLLPSIQDVHGTAQIIRTATKVILFGPDYSTSTSLRFSTLFHVAKFRHRGPVKMYIAKCSFDIKRHSYDSEFMLGSLSKNGEQFEPYSGTVALPDWIPREYHISETDTFTDELKTNSKTLNKNSQTKMKGI